MGISFDDADTIFKDGKQIISPHWRTIINGRGRSPNSQVHSRVQLNGAIRRGVFVRVISYPISLTSFTFQLEVEQANTRTAIPLYRLETNPTQAHSNSKSTDEELSFLFIKAGVQHEHIFYDSLKSNGELPTRPDRFARLVDGNLNDFDSAWVYFCDKVNIINGNIMPRPTDQGQLI